jgi:hypothetical protein
MRPVVTSRAPGPSRARRRHHPARRALLGVLAAGLLPALAAPGAASASNDTTCNGSVRLDRSVALSEGQTTYRFYCDQPIAGYSILSNLEIDSFQAESQVIEPATNSPLGGQGFDCFGPLPGNGFSCNQSSGSRGADAGKYVTGSLSTDTSPCVATVNYWIVVSDTKGNTSGPFETGKTRNCPPVKKKKRAKRARHR